ncbi:MAG: protein kinase [Candidatus Acidiferrales bacterium]
MAAPSELTGLLLGHYRVRDLIGAGGMGVVYRAFDERLNRDVALKILQPNASTDDGRRKRFRKEALLLSSVNHPNIASIFDFDTHDGVDFIVMELIAGVRLSDRIAAGPLPESEASYLGRQILSALHEAHSHGIVHQDLKPGNIIVGSDQHLKVLDFGLAKVFESAESAATESLPQFDERGGTLPYMAPELLRGHAADPRSDIWSFGVVLYEMVSGNRPFRGHTTFEISSAILGSDPPKLPGTVSSGFNALVSRCLIKEPGGRFQTAGEAAAALESCNAEPQGRRIFGARSVAMALALLAIIAFGFGYWKMKERDGKPSLPNSKQLAILPLSDSTESPEVAAFGVGLDDTLTTRLTELTRTHDLQVIPASEIRSKKVTTLQQASQEFGVNLGLELGVHRSGELLRVNYILVDAKTHRQLRGDTITARADDPFTLEDRVSDSIVKALDLELEPQERNTLADHGTLRPAAYDYYLQGRGYLKDYQKPESIDSAISVFTKALEQDSDYALAEAGLGEAYWRKYRLTKDASYVEKAEAECTLATHHKPLAEGYVCLGLVENGTGKYEESARSFEEAISLDPTSDDAMVGAASAYESLGKKDQAERTYRRAISLRPQYWRNYGSLGAFYYRHGEYSQAAEMFSEVIALAPDSFRGYSNLGGTQILQGQYAAAIGTLQKSIEIRQTSGALSNLGTAYFNLHRFDDAAQSFKAAIEFDKDNYVLWGNLGSAYYYGNHRDDSMKSYNQAIKLNTKYLIVNPQDATALSDIAGFYSMIGKRENALVAIQKAQELSPEDPEILFNSALVYNELGDHRRAKVFLGKSLDAGYSPTEIRDTPSLDNLRSDPEFQQVIKNHPR